MKKKRFYVILSNMLSRRFRFTRNITTVNPPKVIFDSENSPYHHLVLPEYMKYLYVVTSTPIDPWEDETVLKVFPSLPRSSDQCYERLLYLKKIDNEAYIKSKENGECPPCPMSLE